MLRQHLESQRQLQTAVGRADDLDDQHRAQPLPRLLRRPRKEDATDDDAVFDAVESPEPGPLAQLEQATEARAIAACLGRLEEKQQRAVRIAFYEGLTHTELAQKMGEPLGTVKTWVRRGLTKLKDCLSAAGLSSA